MLGDLEVGRRRWTSELENHPRNCWSDGIGKDATEHLEHVTLKVKFGDCEHIEHTPTMRLCLDTDENEMRADDRNDYRFVGPWRDGHAQKLLDRDAAPTRM